MNQSRLYNKATISDDRTSTSNIEDRELVALREKTGELSTPRTSARFRTIIGGGEQGTESPLNTSIWAKDGRADIDFQSDRMPTNPETIGTAPFSMSEQTLPLTVDHELNMQSINDRFRGLLALRYQKGLDQPQVQDCFHLLEACMQHIEKAQKIEEPFKHHILYRLWRVEQQSSRRTPDGMVSQFENDYTLSSPYLDAPMWTKGLERDHEIQSNSLLKNFALYLEKNKDISFLVYHDFDPRENSIMASTVMSSEILEPPRATSQSIKPRAVKLQQCIRALLESRPEFEEFLRDYDTSGEVVAPYLFVYHSRNHLDEIKQQLDSAAQTQFQLFIDYVMDNYEPQYAMADALLAEKHITPAFMQYLFKPGEVLVSQTGGVERGFLSTSWPKARKLNPKYSSQDITETGFQALLPDSSKEKLHGQLNSSPTSYEWEIPTLYWKFDGSFQRYYENLVLKVHDDNNQTRPNKPKDESSIVPITHLTVYPIRFAAEEITRKLRRRGDIFWKCRSRCLVSYNERTSEYTTTGERHMVDMSTYHKLHEVHSTKSRDELGSAILANDSLPAGDFGFLLPLSIKAFNLRRKNWIDLQVDQITDVQWNREAFDHLVIHPKSRDLIQALVSSAVATEKSTDFITSKGNGLILLLHGGPGTGKTLTAESVAEMAKKPLYRVTCGDIGTKAEQAEKYLESVLHLGKIWDCVVLLDEADVFLEQRGLEDLERNALVSVFLRVLEYHEGILILTSNRVGRFDEAFKSRIQLALHYPALSSLDRQSIWEIFLRRLDSFKDDQVDTTNIRQHIRELAKVNMNGRQIRNAITNARQYAGFKKVAMTYEHLKDVIEVSCKFDKYLENLQGGSQDKLMQDEAIR